MILRIGGLKVGLRSDGVGNGLVQRLHVRTNLVSPEHPLWSLLVASLSKGTPHFILRFMVSRALKQPAEHLPARHPEGLEHVERKSEELRERLPDCAALFG